MLVKNGEMPSNDGNDARSRSDAMLVRVLPILKKSPRLPKLQPWVPIRPEGGTLTLKKLKGGKKFARFAR